MNTYNTIQYNDILISLLNHPFTNQRNLSELTGYSLGAVNKCLTTLVEDGLLTKSYTLTQKATSHIKDSSPSTAIILAAGFGMRMVPINTVSSKGLLEIDGEPLVERLIKQLNQVGINEIYIVVGFMKEQYDYLIDKYNVHLIVNTEYASKNNLHSLALAKEHLANSYIIPCDVWCNKNPFSKSEAYSWYMVSEIIAEDSNIRVTRKRQLVKTDSNGNSMIGISYITKNDSKKLKKLLEKFDSDSHYENSFWEGALFADELVDSVEVFAKTVSSSDVVEINTYEQLRELDEDSKSLKSDAIKTTAKVLNADESEIQNISILKKGMTNRSFFFTCCGEKYIMRIPGEGTDKLINRDEEAQVYAAISGKGICDDLVYINPKNGYKITKFINNVKAADPSNESELVACMKKLRDFHNMKLKVNHTFDIFGKIDFYQSLWNGNKSIYKDYEQTKANVLSLKPFIEKHAQPFALTHIDAVYDNFLFSDKGLQLTDWEYSAMQDQDVDLAMWSIYALYNKEQIDHLIDIYFEGNCPKLRRIKIYCYVAACGLLWSNWCEYKRNLGVEFGEYSLVQYRYAKDFYKIASQELKEEEEK